MTKESDEDEERERERKYYTFISLIRGNQRVYTTYRRVTHKSPHRERARRAYFYILFFFRPSESSALSTIFESAILLENSFTTRRRLGRLSE